MTTKEEAVQDYLNWAFSLILVADPTNPANSGICLSETPKKICTNNKDHQCGCDGDTCDMQSNTCHKTLPDYSCPKAPCCQLKILAISLAQIRVLKQTVYGMQ